MSFIKFIKFINNTLKKAKINFLRNMISHKGGIDITETRPVPSWIGSLTKPFKNLVIHTQYLSFALQGPYAFEAMRTGCNIGLFDLLDQKPGMKTEQITQALNLNPYPVQILLATLVFIKLIHKIDDQYYNDPFLSQSLLKNFANGFIRKHIEYMHHIVIPALAYLQESVVQNKPVGLVKMFGENAKSYYYELSQNPEKNQYFEQFMRAYTHINRDRVASLPLFSKFGKILDVGGNTGELAMAIAHFHPSVRITVFDFPAIVEETRQHFQACEYKDRLDTFAGDVLTSDFPKGYDCILFSHFMDIFSEDTNRQFLSKAFTSLNPNGYVSIFTPIVRENNPSINDMLGLYFLCLADGKGQFYSEKAIMRWLKETGFTLEERRFLPYDEMIIFGNRSK